MTKYRSIEFKKLLKESMKNVVKFNFFNPNYKCFHFKMDCGYLKFVKNYYSEKLH